MRKTLAEALEAEIERRRQTQREAAAAIGTDPSNLSRWLKGGDVSKEHIAGLMAYLGFDQNELGGAIIEERIRRHAREVSEH